MDLWERAAVALAVTPTFGRVSAPFFLVGGGYRVQERLVLGLTAYVAGGVGSSYNDVEEVGGEDLDLAVGLGEVALPTSVRALDNLSFGVAFGVAFAFQNSDIIEVAAVAHIQVEGEHRSRR